jgi:MFS family permease
MALAASYFIQLGAGVFALAVVARVVSAAPPRSLAILEGPYRYDSGAFWQVAPAITAALFLLAIAANWRSRRRGLLVGALAAFVLSGAVAGGVLAPLFADITAAGYRDAVDPELQRRATLWYAADWGARCVDAVACVALLVALTRPVPDRVAA